MDETLEARLETLERAITDGEHDLAALAEAGEISARLDGVESDQADLTDRVAELEAATQALRGYVGNIRSVNCEVEDRAELALSKVERLEDELRDTDSSPGRQAADSDEPRIEIEEFDGASMVDQNPSPSSGKNRQSVAGAGLASAGRARSNGSNESRTHDRPKHGEHDPHTKQTAIGRGSRVPDRGETDGKTTHEHHRCRACGRPEEAAGAGRQELNGDGSASPATAARLGGRIDDPETDVPTSDRRETECEDGAFQRIRNML